MELSPQLQSALITGGCAIFASISAITGVWITLRSNRAKHREDAERDLRKHRESAELSVRKDALLSFLDASSEIIWWIALHPSPDVTIAEGLAAMKRFTATTARVHATAGEQTLEAALTLQEAILSAWMEAHRWKLLLIGIEADLQSTRKAAAEAEKLAVEQFNPADENAERRASVKDAHDRFIQLVQEATERSGALQGASTVALQRAQKSVRALLQPQDDLLLIARGDLHVPISHDWYLRRKKRYYEAVERLAASFSKPASPQA